MTYPLLHHGRGSVVNNALYIHIEIILMSHLLETVFQILAKYACNSNIS